MSTVTSLWRH